MTSRLITGPCRSTETDLGEESIYYLSPVSPYSNWESGGGNSLCNEEGTGCYLGPVDSPINLDPISNIPQKIRIFLFLMIIQRNNHESLRRKIEKNLCVLAMIFWDLPHGHQFLP